MNCFVSTVAVTQSNKLDEYAKTMNERKSFIWWGWNNPRCRGNSFYCYDKYKT